MAFRNSRIKAQVLHEFDYKAKCGQVLNSLKTACSHPCSQGVYGVNQIKCDFLISAHSLSLEFKSFYGLWSFFKKREKSSPILTTLPHHTVFGRVVRIGEDRSK